MIIYPNDVIKNKETGQIFRVAGHCNPEFQIKQRGKTKTYEEREGFKVIQNAEDLMLSIFHENQIKEEFNKVPKEEFNKIILENHGTDGLVIHNCDYKYFHEDHKKKISKPIWSWRWKACKNVHSKTKGK